MRMFEALLRRSKLLYRRNKKRSLLSRKRKKRRRRTKRKLRKTHMLSQLRLPRWISQLMMSGNKPNRRLSIRLSKRSKLSLRNTKWEVFNQVVKHLLLLKLELMSKKRRERRSTTLLQRSSKSNLSKV